MQLTTDSFRRPEDLSATRDPSVLYARSYLLIRMVVGGIGVLLPTMLFVLDWTLLGGSASLRGSLSAYYHSAARDLFVAGLAVVGVFLVSYMAGQKSTWDYWLSTIAGVAALGVAFFPTQRPSLDKESPLCGSSEAIPAGCTQLQHALGETTAAAIHYASAAIFILALAMICFVFATREKKRGQGDAQARFYRVSGVIILVSVVWIVVGESLNLIVFGIHPLYMGEVVSVYAFGASWLAKAQDLLKLVFDRQRS